MPRFFEQLESRMLFSALPTLSDFASGLASFVPTNQNFDTTTSTGMHALSVLNVKVGNQFYVYYEPGLVKGIDRTADVYLATTTDGITFVDHGPVLTHGDSQDRTFATFPGVWKDGTAWYMVVEARSGSQSNIELATSSDGLHWTKRGLILSHGVVPWASQDVGTPSLYKVGTTWYLYFHGFDGTDVQIGVASGTDIMHLSVHPNPAIRTASTGWDSGTVGKCSIQYSNGRYWMTFEASTDQNPGGGDFSRSNWTSGMAVSTDLIHWTTYRQRPVLLTAVGRFGYDLPEWFDAPDGYIYIYSRAVSGITTRAVLQFTPTAVYQAESNSSLRHQIGRRDGDGWSVNVLDPPEHFLSYGPYTTAVPAGSRTAEFRLLLDNVTADNNRILTLDVFDSTAQVVLSASDITRRQFAKAFAYQTFDLNFDAIAGHALEFRVFWHNFSYTKLDSISVF